MALKNKIKLFLDFDEVITNSIDAMCKVLNNVYGANLEAKDIKTWNFLEYQRQGFIPEDVDMSTLIEDYFESNAFFENLTLKDGIELFFNNDSFDITIVTKGTKLGNKKKIDFLKKAFNCNENKIVALSLDDNKNCVNMSGGYFIDDCIQNLIDVTTTNKKFLLINNVDAEWNRLPSYEAYGITPPYRIMKKEMQITPPLTLKDIYNIITMIEGINND
jgi:5'(3')-deoxyribonucleotidase